MTLPIVRVTVIKDSQIGFVDVTGHTTEQLAEALQIPSAEHRLVDSILQDIIRTFPTTERYRLSLDEYPEVLVHLNSGHVYIRRAWQSRLADARWEPRGVPDEVPVPATP